ncbi:MAG: hypothetical protein ACI8PG_001862, partial [Planctomycetota bacterium]
KKNLTVRSKDIKNIYRFTAENRASRKIFFSSKSFPEHDLR